MMAQVNAGRVRFVGRGEYNNSTQYYVFDLVSYNGNSYYAKVDTIGHLPTDTTYWQLVAEKGNVGPTGLTGNGISSITKTSTSGLVDTYTITYTNGNTTTFDVSNGNGIDRIEKTATVGNKDTYTIYFTNGSTTTYEVSNGEVTREELEEEVERLSMIYNAFPSTTGEGEEPSINGTAEVPFKEIGLKGNTSQESTTGKNLLNLPSSITIPNRYTAFSKNINIPAGTYTLSATKITTSGEYPSLIAFRDANGVLVQKTLSSSSLSTTFTVSSNITAIWIYSQDTYAHSQDVSTTFEGLMVSSSGGDYEPYTGGNPAPSPDYPYPVNVVTGDNEVKVEGKNLFDESNLTLATVQEDGKECYKIAGTTASTSNVIWNEELKENTQYTISMVAKRVQYFNHIVFYYKDGTNNYVNFTNTTFQRINATSQANKTLTKIQIDTGDLFAFNYIEVGTIQLEKGTTATPYTPYVSQTYPINLGSMELCKIGDYQDYLYKENGVWYKYGAIGKVVLDGSEQWAGGTSGAVSSNYTYVYTSAYDNLIKTSFYEAKCNKLNNLGTWMGINTQVNTDTIAIGDPGSNKIRIMILTSRLSEQTTTGFKNWLTENKPEVYYVLSTPTITPITDTTLIEQLDNLEKAYSYDTQTNISQTNQDKPFIISYEAILSLRNVLNS